MSFILVLVNSDTYLKGFLAALTFLPKKQSIMGHVKVGNLKKKFLVPPLPCA
jgi:hypothetical protein